MLGLDIAYMQAKFDHSSFSRSGDMVGADQNLDGPHDLTTPLSGIVCHLSASTCYDYPIYQISSLCLCPLLRYERQYKIVKMGWFWVIRGHSRSLEIASFDNRYTEHTSSY